MRFRVNFVLFLTVQWFRIFAILLFLLLLVSFVFLPLPFTTIFQRIHTTISIDSLSLAHVSPQLCHCYDHSVLFCYSSSFFFIVQEFFFSLIVVIAQAIYNIFVYDTDAMMQTMIMTQRFI